MSLKQKFNSLQRIAFDNNYQEGVRSEREDLANSNYNSQQVSNSNNMFQSGINNFQKNCRVQSSQQLLSNGQQLKNSVYNSMVNSNMIQDNQKSMQQQQSYTSGQTYDGSSYCSQSQVNFEKVKLFERITYSIDQLSDCILDYLNANQQQVKMQMNAKAYSKWEITSIKNMLHATVGNFLVETVNFDDPVNKENQRSHSNHNFSNQLSHRMQSNNEFDDGCSTLPPTSKNTFTNRPISSLNQPSPFFTEYHPDEFVLHQEIEKLNEIINQMQSEKEWMQNQISEMQYEDIISLKQERQTFEEIKGDLADYIFNFKKNFLSVQLSSQKASDIVQSDLFNEFYDILTTTENNWKVSDYSKKQVTHYKDDMKFLNLRWKQKKSTNQLTGIGGTLELKKRSRSVDFKNSKPQLKTEKLSDLNDQIIEQQQQIQKVKCEKEIEFSIFHTFLRQFTQNSASENISNIACIQEQQELIEQQQQIINQVQIESQQTQNNNTNNENDTYQNNMFNQQKSAHQFKKYPPKQQLFDDNGDSPIFSNLRAGTDGQPLDCQEQQEQEDNVENIDQENQQNNTGTNTLDQCTKLNNFRKSSDFNSLRNKKAVRGVKRNQDQDDKVLFTLNSDGEQIDEEADFNLKYPSQEVNNFKKSNDSFIDLPLQIQSMKQSGNHQNNTKKGNHLMNIPSQNMNFTIGNDQSDFLLQNIDPSFNQEINNISCINKLEDEPQQITDFLGTLEQKPTSRFMCQSSFKKQKIAQSMGIHLYKNNQLGNDQVERDQNNEERQYDDLNDEFVQIDEIQINHDGTELQKQIFRNNQKANNYDENEQFNNKNFQQRNSKNNSSKPKRPIMMSFNNKEDIMNTCAPTNEQQEDEIEKSKIESFMNENFDDVNNSLNLEDIEQIEELCEQNMNQHTQIKKRIKHLKNIDLPKLDLSTINCTDQIKNMRMTIGQQFMNNQSLQAALQISSTKSQTATNQFGNPQTLFNMISPIHSTQQMHNRQHSFGASKKNLSTQQVTPLQNYDTQNQYQQNYAQQGGASKLNESILNQTNINPNNNTQLDLLRGLNDTVLNQMEKIEIERSNFYQNYQNLLNEKNEILQREMAVKNTIIDLQREVHFLSEENSRLQTEIEQQQLYITKEMDIIKKENENNKIKKDKLRQAKEQLAFRKKQQEDKEKLVGQQQLMNMLQEKKIIFQKQTLDQQWSEQDKKKAEIERMEKLIGDEWENVKKETKKIQEFIAKQKQIKENLQRDSIKEQQSIQQQKEEITAQYKILNQKESDLKEFESAIKEKEKKKEEILSNSLKQLKQKEEGIKMKETSIKEQEISIKEKEVQVKEREVQLKEKENVFKEKEISQKEKENTLKDREYQITVKEQKKQEDSKVSQEFEDKQNALYKKEQELREREKITKIALQESIAKKTKYNEELKRLKEYEESLGRKEQELTAMKYEIMSEKMKYQEQQDKIKLDRSKFKGMIPNLKTLANRMSDYEDSASEVSNSTSSRSGSLLRTKKY